MNTTASAPFCVTEKVNLNLHGITKVKTATVASSTSQPSQSATSSTNQLLFDYFVSLFNINTTFLE